MMRRQPEPDLTEAVLGDNPPGWQRKAWWLVNTDAFQWAVVVTIILNAIVLTLGTYEQVPHVILDKLDEADFILGALFLWEVVTRLAAHRFNLRVYFRDGWNVFDLLVLIATLTPQISGSVLALRLARLLRVARLGRLLPDFHVLLNGLRRAAGPAMSLLMLTFLLCFLYAVVGYTLFHDVASDYYQDLGQSLLTLFVLLTLEGWNEILWDLQEVSPWAIPYVISFVLIGTYVVINLVVGIVITSLESAYEEHHRDTSSDAELTEQITQLKKALEGLEEQLQKGGGSGR